MKSSSIEQPLTSSALSVSRMKILFSSRRSRRIAALLSIRFMVSNVPLPDWLYATEKEEGEKLAEVKFFNEDKGYGFVMVEGHGQDIFIHSRTLEQNRLTGLDSGQRVLVRVADDGSGPVIDTIRFYVGNEEFDVEGDRPPIGNRSGEDIEEEEAMTVEESSGVRKNSTT